MTQMLKPVVSFLMFLIVLLFISTILSITTSFPIWLSTIFSLICAALAGWFAWSLVAGKKTNMIISVIGSALILGGLCFTLGFWGPMAFAKDTSQGPMVGIFIAAPLGVIMGAIGGYFYASRQRTSFGK